MENPNEKPDTPTAEEAENEPEVSCEAEKPLSSNIQNLSSILRNEIADPDDDEDPEKTIKVVVLGDGTCGKTSLCTRFAQRDFTGRYIQTLGVDFFSRRISLPQQCNVLFQVWDVGGQSISANMLSKYVYGSDCVVFVYDVTNAASFESITDWVTVVKRIIKQQEKPIYLSLVGNKTDLEHRRTVRIDKHTRFADQYGMSSHYVSAKTGDSVDLSFKLIAAEVLGIQLSKVDVELAINAIEAPVAVLDEQPPAKESDGTRKVLPQVTPTVTTRDAEGTVDVRRDFSKSSSVCVVQ
ncbi:Ras-related protein Rab-28 [Aphelenchoides besseyi]|nr:Ras-related protein Rab-28 [Aphelenchoides besseyi]KAI6202137.1 Ras-related protein Rab-28 [Aphelenchoides besseyi]